MDLIFGSFHHCCPFHQAGGTPPEAMAEIRGNFLKPKNDRISQVTTSEKPANSELGCSVGGNAATKQRAKKTTVEIHFLHAPENERRPKA